MKRFVTKFLALSFALMCLSSVSFSKTVGKTEVIRPTAGGKMYRGVFNEQPKYIKLGGNEPLAGKKETLKYYDQASIDAGSFFPISTPVGPLTDQNGDPLISNNGAGSPFTYVGVGSRFTSSLANPKLDSVRIWFTVDSMENITGNNLEVGVVKQRLVAGSDGTERPFPDLGTTGAIGTSFTSNHKTIAYSKLMVGGGQINSIKVTFTSGLTLPEADFFVYLNSRVFASASNIVTNAISVLADSVNIGDGADPVIDPETMRAYRIALDDSSQYYTSGFAIFSNTDNSEVYAPNLWMEAYVRDPTATGVENIKLEGNALAQNFPNPFNPTTEIKYSLATGGKTTLKVTNALGNEVATVVDAFVAAGEHTATFDGSSLPSGTYFYTIKCGDYSSTKRMVLSK